MLIWGLTASYVIKESNTPILLTVMLTGLIFWLIIWQTQLEMNLTLFSEVWDRNLVNIFASPLTVHEWIVANILFGLVKMALGIGISAIAAFFFFQYNVFIFGISLIPIVVSLILTGWIVGLFIGGLLIRFGQTIQAIAWAGIYLVVPFFAVYYSITILPGWAQFVGHLLPPSYVFEAMRDMIYTGYLSYDKLLISFALNGIYLALSIWFFIAMFNKSKKLGLGRLI